MIQWQYGERVYQWYNHRTKEWINELRQARWFVQTDALGRNREVVCYKVPGNVGAFGGDILYAKSKTFDYDSEYNVIPNSEHWFEMWDYLFLSESHILDNSDSYQVEIKGNIFEHPNLLKFLPNCFVDGIVERVGTPRFEGSKDDYFSYIQSHAWKRRKAQIIKRDDCACAICGARHTPLHVHHLSYAHFEDEKDSELITLCADCHQRIHKESDKFYLKVSRLPICERVGEVDYSRLFAMCCDADMFINEAHIGIFIATVLGISMEREYDYWIGEREYKASFDTLVALLDIAKGNAISVEVKCHGEEEIRDVLKIGDELGFHWWDESNGLASTGIWEICGCDDSHKELHFPDTAIITFSMGIVMYDPHIGDGVDAKSFIDAYQISRLKQ